MSVQRAEVHWARYLDGNRRVVLEADHARIVAEATAEARAAERRHWEARFRNAEQAHAAALAAFERLPGHTAHAYIETSDWSGGQSAQVRFQQSEQGRWVDKGDVLTLLGNAAAAPRTLTSDCLHLTEMYVGQSSRDNEYGRRSSVIECLACGALRLDDETVPPNRLAGGDFDTSGQPRTLTADDPEPAVRSVVLDKDGTAGQRVYTDDGVTTIWQFSDDDWCHEWGTVDRVRGPVTLIHDGEDR